MIKAGNVFGLLQILEKSNKKATELNPAVKVIEFGEYEVENSKKGFYKVFIGINNYKEIFIACVCRGGLQGYGCYHAVKAFEKHQELIESKSSEISNPNDQPYLKDTSHLDKPTKRIGNIIV